MKKTYPTYIYGLSLAVLSFVILNSFSLKIPTLSFTGGTLSASASARVNGVVNPEDVPVSRLNPVSSTQSMALKDGMPSLEDFRLSVSDGAEGIVRGVYVENVLALPVVQQPELDASFVSEEEGVATLFGKAVQGNTTGLLAHNYLSGRLFYGLKAGQIVNIIYGDGKTLQYIVDEIHQYQRLTRQSLRSDLIDLETGRQVTTDEVYSRFYRGDHRVTFQTCLENEGQLDWGLIFVVARPVITGQ